MLFLRIVFLIVIIVRLAMVIGRWRTTLSGDTVNVDNEVVTYRVRRNRKAKRLSVSLGIDVPDKTRFRARRENWFDRFAKSVGLAREFQTQDQQFDSDVYLLADDPELSNMLMMDSTLRAALSELLQSTRVVYCSRGQLWAELRDKNFDYANTNEQVARRASELLLAALVRVKQRIASKSLEAWTPSRDPRALLEKILLTTMVAIGIAGIVAFFMALDGLGFPRQLAHAQINLLGFEYGAYAAAGIVAVVLLAMRASSRTHLLLLEALFIGAPSSWLIAHAGYDWANRAYDNSDGTTISVVVIEQHITKGSKGSRSYHLTISGWPASSEHYSLQVGRGIYNRVYVGQCVAMTLHDGHYGDQWASSFVPQTGPCVDSRTQGIYR